MRKYRYDAAGKFEKANASEIIEGIKRMSNRDREERGKEKRNREREATSTVSTKLENLLHDNFTPI